MKHKFKGEELTFHENGDIIHRIYGKLRANSSELTAWNILIENFQSSERYPFIELLVREVWNKISTPALCEAIYKVDKGYKRMVIQQLNKPTENDITINEWYNDVYVKG